MTFKNVSVLVIDCVKMAVHLIFLIFHIFFVKGVNRNMTNTIFRVKKFLEASLMAKTKFCQCVNLSQSMLFYFLNGERDLATDTERRVNDFIDGYIARLNEI